MGLSSHRRFLAVCCALITTLATFYLHSPDTSTTNASFNSNAPIITSYNNKQLQLLLHNSTTPFRVLCSSASGHMVWGSYKARCENFKSWLDASSCTWPIEMTTGVDAAAVEYRRKQHPVGADEQRNITFDATVYVKAVPPEKKYLGKTFVDVVDEYKIRR